MYLANHDKLLLTLSDSSIHVVHQVSTLPNLSVSTEGLEGDKLSSSATSLTLTQALRSVAAKVEYASGGKSVAAGDFIENNGMTFFDSLGTALWLHE